MARKFLTPIDLNSNEVQNVKAQQLASDPGSPVNGQWWYNTTANIWRTRINGTTRDMTWVTTTTPQTLTSATTNTAGTAADAAHADHTHAITTSSSGTASTIAAYDSNGKLSSAATASTDGSTILTTKGYVDALAQGLDVHASVRVTTTAALSTLGTTPTYTATGGTSARGQITWVTGPTTIDGVTLANSDRILVKNEGSGTHASNGIWVRTSQNTWDRATDFDSDAEVTSGAFFFVEEGTAAGDTGWVLSTNNPITLGGASGTALTFVQFNGAGAYTASNPLLKTGNDFSLQYSSTYFDLNAGTTLQLKANGTSYDRLAQAAALSVLGNSTNATANLATIAAGADFNILRRSGTAIGFGSIDLSQSGAVGTSVLGYANGGTGQSTYAAGDIVYASAINTLAKRTIGSTNDLLTVVGGVPTWQSAATTGLARKYSVAVGDNASTTITVTHNLNTQDVIVRVYQNSTTWDEVECDIQHDTVNTVKLIFTTAPTTSQYKCVVIG